MTDIRRMDLHTHSIKSDGTLTPREVILAAKAAGLSAVALTDHDTVSGLKEAADAANECGIELVYGVEFSAVYKGRDIHILGYDIDIEQPEFVDEINQFLASRNRRNEKMYSLMQANGLDITADDVAHIFPGTEAVTRAHFARVIMEKGYVSTMKEAFSKYLEPGCPCYLAKEEVTPLHAISMIKKANGKAVLAHPMLYHYRYEELVSLVRYLISLGLDGIETIYTCNSAQDETLTRRIARTYHLKMTGGSDFHGSNKKDINIGTGYGQLLVPYELLDELRR